MPTVTIQGSSSHSTKEYVPLVDEVNPPFGHVAPSPSVSNCPVIYSKPLRSSGSNTPTDETFAPNSSSSRVLGNIAEDLSSRFKSGSGSGDYSLDFEDESDISNQNRLMGKGKGKERARDHDGYVRQADSSSTSHGQGAYPPLNEEEEQEKRVQTNLAKFAARETARRKAARTSRIASPTGSQSPSASSSTASLSRGGRPLSPLTEGISSKRSSLMGFVGGLVGKDKQHGSSGSHGSNELELASPTRSSHNPYDIQPPRKVTSPSSPTMNPSSPFADPVNVPLESPMEGGSGFGYAGPSWRGGAAAVPTSEDVLPPSKPERWWHSLCAWGADLDGGHGKKTSNQAGRTNPFE